MEKQILDLAEDLKRLKDLKSEVETQEKDINADIDRVTANLTSLMSDNELPSFTHSGFTFSLSTRTFASALAGNKEALYEALRVNGYGDIITETVNANTLASTVGDLIEQNGDTLPGWLEGKVNTYGKVSVRISKSTKKS
jgi:flagellar basal body L-ring protein FlgH